MLFRVAEEEEPRDFKIKILTSVKPKSFDTGDKISAI
jgi:hypothetical protein